MTRILDSKLIKVVRELKAMEHKVNGEVRRLSLEREYEQLQRRYYRTHGFNWNPLMYEGRREE